MAHKSSIQSLAILHLDYCHSLFLGPKKANIDNLQHLQNSAARFNFSIPCHESAKPYTVTVVTLITCASKRELNLESSHMPKLTNISQNYSRYTSLLEIPDPAGIYRPVH